MTKKRIIHFLDYKGFTKPEFYEITGIKRGLLDSDKLNSTVSDIYLAKIIASFPDLNVKWLLTGEGDMIVKESTKSETMGIAADGDTITIPREVYDLLQGTIASQQRTIEVLAEKRDAEEQQNAVKRAAHG